MELGDLRLGLACSGLCFGTVLLSEVAKYCDLDLPLARLPPGLVLLPGAPGFLPLLLGSSRVGIVGGIDDGGFSLLQN